MERERVIEPDADQISNYEKIVRHYEEWADRQKNGELLIRGDKRDYQISRQGFIKFRGTAALPRIPPDPIGMRVRHA